MVEINELARKRSDLITNAAVASQNKTLIDDPVTAEAIELNVIAPLIVEISERDQRIAALEAQLAEAKQALTYIKDVKADVPDARYRFFAVCTAEIALAALEATPPAPKDTDLSPLDDWHEDCGHVVWWTWRDGEWLGEPCYIGHPLCSDWPEYHTHWSPHPQFPAALTATQESGQ